MARSKITSKYQVTLPAEVRAKLSMRPGEMVEVEAVDSQTVILRGPEKMKDPMSYFRRKKPLLDRHIPPGELDELMEP